MLAHVLFLALLPLQASQFRFVNDDSIDILHKCQLTVRMEDVPDTTVFDHCVSGERKTMNAGQIIDAIKRRRNQFFDTQIVGNADDPKLYSDFDVARAISDEYDSLLAEIGSEQS